MLSISHGLTGALIATKIPNPIIWVPLVLASHYLEDWILHWDVGTGLSAGTRKRTTAFVLEILDLALTGILLFALFQYGKPTLNINAYLGAFVSLLPDFLEAPRNFLNYNPPWLKPLNDFHHGFHHSTSNIILGLAPQIVLLAGIIWLH